MLLHVRFFAQEQEKNTASHRANTTAILNKFFMV